MNTDGESVLEVPPRSQPERTAVCNGISAIVESYAVAPISNAQGHSGVILLSLVGSSTAVNAIWAGFISGHRVYIHENNRYRGLDFLTDEDGENLKYRTFRKSLPRLGKAHAVIVAEQAVTSLVRPGPNFYVICRKPEEIPMRFKLAFDRAIPHPALDEWAPELLARGQSEELVREATTADCSVLEIVSDHDRWKTIISTLAVERNTR